MKTNGGPQARDHFVDQLRQRLSDGMTLGDALKSSTPAVPPMEVSVIRAAETSGMLEQAFRYLTEHYESVFSTRKKALARLVYPALLIHLAILLPAIPEFVRTQDLASTLGLSVVLLVALYVITAGLVLGFRVIHRAARTDRAADGILRRLPLWGKVRRASALYRFCSVFRMYLECGQKISTSAAAGGEASNSAVVQSAADALANTARDGHPVGSAIFNLQSVFPNELASGIHSAEQTGMLSEELGRWANLYREKTMESLDRFGAWAPRIIYILAALFVAWQIIKMYASIYAPIFELLDGI